MRRRFASTIKLLFYFIFGFWNIVFLLILYGFLLPFIGIPLFRAIINGEVEWEFLGSFLGLIATPILCTIIGVKFFKRQPKKLMGLFYGVEAPLVLLYLVRLFVLRELTPASHLILVSLFICICAFLIELISGYNQYFKAIAWVQAIAQSLILFFGLYLSTLLLFYSLPVGAYFLEEVFSFRWLRGISLYDLLHPMSLLFIILFSLSVTLFIFMPYVLAGLYFKSAQNILRSFKLEFGKVRTGQVILAVMTTWLVLFIYFGHQPQVTAFELLKNPALTTSDRATLITKKEIIQKGLINAYLYPYRYLSTVRESNSIRVMYRDAFGLPEATCQWLQDSYNWLISPFLYQGYSKDSDKAAKLYAQFFDTPIQKGESQAVRHALQSTAIIDNAKAGVLNINQKKVWLKKQEVTLEEHGNWADVEIYEIYENQTFDVEEIFYYFSLPESAVITGLWLGDNENLATRFPFKVATRGAAQKVYNSQVRRTRPVDPALLEQVGTRQYRLRAFPVPPKLRATEINNPNNRPTQMHLWLTYKVMQQDGQWQLPHLQEQRNIFWTKSTKRIRNGEKVKGFNQWLETNLPATAKHSQLQQINLLDRYNITAKPLAEKDYSLPKNKHFALILDTSYSMREHSQKLAEAFKWLQKNIFTTNKIDLYVTSAEGIPPQRIDNLRQFNLHQQVFYGTLQPKEMLRQFSQLQADDNYDGIVLITDKGSYELANDKKNITTVIAPLWLLHLDSLASAYDDATLKTIQNSDGGVTTEIVEPWQRMATKQAEDRSVVRVVDGYGWSMQPTEEDFTTTDEGFAPLAARVLVRGLSKEIEDNNLTQLDAIHTIAKNYKIVTPYSSMIVLVNDEQREALKKAEAEADRFARKVEDGKENLNKPNNPLNNNSASIPEPRNIFGLIAIALFLIISRWQLIYKRTKNSIN